MLPDVLVKLRAMLSAHLDSLDDLCIIIRLINYPSFIQRNPQDGHRRAIWLITDDGRPTTAFV
jgi:hypothetical protein